VDRARQAKGRLRGAPPGPALRRGLCLRAKGLRHRRRSGIRAHRTVAPGPRGAAPLGHRDRHGHGHLPGPAVHAVVRQGRR
jgi:hypothetical protein